MFLEHLASDNGADMHKYNTLYTRRLNWHVLTPESYQAITKPKTGKPPHDTMSHNSTYYTIGCGRLT